MRNLKLSGQLVQELGREIISGELESGQVLPSVEALSEMKGVSRTVTREALKGLSTLGLIASQPKVGTVVRDRSDWQWWNTDVLRWSIDTSLNQRFLLQVVEIRLVIEPAAVAMAAKNATDEDRNEIRLAFAKLQQSTDNESDWATADYDFHDSIIAAAHNELMLNLIRLLRDALLYSRRKTIPVLKAREEQPRANALTQHKAVMDAVCKGDEAGAKRTMTELLQSVTALIEESNEGSADVGKDSSEIS
ncbi:FadR/GntR family transcriptional regulator [Alicyclobacillus sp. SO9]|uniref:FadR/GntR family transcriptional regulator n=1 Tax=Alicyclobacillus sp. SO9 TaxID=2665646 RepID=UPI0018E82933|nr:FadR/GntR family transcriptional regulator [Alicyclobacillus sp. SO9]QQE77587.1 FadR family transcriptional regulator [Alicyclobacillus sp. SO9]